MTEIVHGRSHGELTSVPVGDATVVDMFHQTARANAERPALRWRGVDGWTAMTWSSYEKAVSEVAAGLTRWGLAPGDRVVILSDNRPEWHIVDLAILSDALVSVPVYQTSAAGQVAYVLRHSGARVCFVGDREQLMKVLAGAAELPALEAIVVIDDSVEVDHALVSSFADLRADGSVRLSIDPSIVERRSAALGGGDLATLVYTSGTTGPPKGAMLSHGNLMATMRSVTSLVQVNPSDRFLSFLPLSHITERSISHFGQIAGGGETWFARGLTTLAEDLQACRPTVFFGVPRVWEKFREAILDHVHHDATPARVLAARYLAPLSPAAGAPGFPRATAVEHRALDLVVGRAIRRSLGLDRARVLACGAAPVSRELLRWFHGIGLAVAEGYGQTEVSLATSFNRPGAIRIGTVGPPVPGVTVRIADDGEILVKGDNVSAGYWHDDAATAALLDGSGWLHSGDLGHLDDDGYLTVTGRKKDLIVTAYGKNISPEEIETRFRMEPLISQAVVIGDGRPFLTALLTLDPEAAGEWAGRDGRAVDMEALSDDADLQARVGRVVARVNAEHSHAEGVRRWRILPHDLTLAAGELTPTLKVKRNAVLDHYQGLIEELYAAP